MCYSLSAVVVSGAMSDGRVLVWDIGSPCPPDYNTQMNHLLTLEARLEIFKLVYSLQGNVLMAACTSGVCGWVVTQQVLQEKREWYGKHQVDVTKQAPRLKLR
jgi:hypothetical protein